VLAHARSSVSDVLVGYQGHLKTAPSCHPIYSGDHRFFGQQNLFIDVANCAKPTLNLTHLDGARFLKIYTSAESAVA